MAETPATQESLFKLALEGKVGRDVPEVKNAVDALNAAKGNPKKYEDGLKAVVGKLDGSLKEHAELKAAGGDLAKIEEFLGKNIEADHALKGEFDAAKGFKPAAAETISNAEKTAGEAVKKFFGAKGFFETQAAKVGGNWGKSGTGMKFARVAGTGLGVFFVGKGIKDLFAPKRNEAGERETGYVVPVLEAAGGALAIYASLLAGGKNAAVGIGR